MPWDTGAYDTYTLIPDSLGFVNLCSLIGINSVVSPRVSHRAQRKHGLAPPDRRPHRQRGHILFLTGVANSIRPVFDTAVDARQKGMLTRQWAGRRKGISGGHTQGDRIITTVLPPL
jgi:hypothetical protein